MDEFILHQGRSEAVLKTLPDASVDAIVTDPPYELGFMGKGWDKTGIAYSVPMWSECLRVLKPGGHLIAFSATRTYHRLVCAIEDAGFEIRDQLAWVYGSGFPKSYNGEWGGTALKPAWEPICLARRPLTGSMEENWRAHGVGGLNVDGCRVPTSDDLNGGAYSAERQDSASEWAKSGSLHKSTGKEFVQPDGRWPANLLHDGSEEVLAHFPDAPGQQGDLQGHSRDRLSLGIYGDMKAASDALARGDAGSAARFFYCAKASKQDRDEGLLHFRPGTVSDGRNVVTDNPYLRGTTSRKNVHPTVKPTELMRWLCRLVTPAGGVVLDPFMGSGSTGKAAVLESLRFIGIDMTPEYVAIARARIEHATRSRPPEQLDLLAEAA